MLPVPAVPKNYDRLRWQRGNRKIKWSYGPVSHMTFMPPVIFWLTAFFCASCALLAYVYVAYPALAVFLAARFGRPVRREEIFPRVTIILTAYNEEECIRAKLENLAALNYPRDLVDVLVASDASSDSTEKIAASYDPQRVRVLRVEGRRGKTACQNAAAAAATGEVLLFTDATTHVQADALRLMVQNFADREVGCAAGTLVYVAEGDSITGRGGETYWSYEMRLRAAESSLGSLIGVSGCLYAVRKSAYRPIDPDLISDFVIAMNMREQGLRTVLAPDAVCFEATLDRGSRELAMRVRVAVRSLNALVRGRRFLNPLRYGLFAWQLWSHKVLRYASPLLWLTALAANAALIPALKHFPRTADLDLATPYLVLLAIQGTVIAAGALGFLVHRDARALKMLERPYYLLLTNLAALIATLRYLGGERMVVWTPIRGTTELIGNPPS
jgi:cellulose synthase/poly-beta-1,6-N-acetylglucosamine synthase-like glycosyltransferase